MTQKSDHFGGPLYGTVRIMAGDRQANFLSPGYAVIAAGVGHGVWGLIAYRSGLREIARAGYFDSVGDGLFRKKHSKDERAAAFWFMAASPLAALTGYLGERAIQAGDRRAVTVAGVATTLITAAGAAAMPRSGFSGAIVLGPWMIRRARELS
jgi:hypothetical protein